MSSEAEILIQSAAGIKMSVFGETRIISVLLSSL